jgi:hypothetical protein
VFQFSAALPPVIFGSESTGSDHHLAGKPGGKNRKRASKCVQMKAAEPSRMEQKASGRGPGVFMDSKQNLWASEPILLPTLPNDEVLRHVSCGLLCGTLQILAVSSAGKVYEFQTNPEQRFHSVLGLPNDKIFVHTICGNCIAFANDTDGGLYAWGVAGAGLGVGSDFPHLERNSVDSRAITLPMQVVFDPIHLEANPTLDYTLKNCKSNAPSLMHLCGTISAAKPSMQKLQVGDRVRLSTSYLRSTSGTSAGPLIPGSVGTVVEIDVSPQPYFVRTEGNQRWWYAHESLTKVADCENAKVNLPATTDPQETVNKILMCVADSLMAAMELWKTEDFSENGRLIEAMRRLFSSELCANLPGGGFLGQDIALDQHFIVPSRTVIAGLSILCREQLTYCCVEDRHQFFSMIRFIRLLIANLNHLVLSARTQRSLDKGECLYGHKLVSTCSSIDPARCGICHRTGRMLLDLVQGCAECQWYICKACHGQSNSCGKSLHFGLSSSGWFKVQEMVKDVCSLAIDLDCWCENQIQQDSNNIDILDFNEIHCTISELICAVSTVAARTKGSGPGFLCPLLGSGQVGNLYSEATSSASWIPKIASKHFHGSALDFFMETITSVEIASEILFSDLVELNDSTDFASFQEVLNSVLSFVSNHSCSGLAKIAKLRKCVYLAFGNIQTAIFLYLSSTKCFGQGGKLVKIINNDWILKFMNIFCQFVKDCEDEIDANFCEGSNYFCGFEAQMNNSLFKTLIPGFLTGLQICDWAHLTPDIIPKLFDCRKAMSCLIAKIPSWKTVHLYWSIHVWQEPSETGLWFLSCRELLHRMVFTKPFQLVSISPELFKWLDEGPLSSYSIGITSVSLASTSMEGFGASFAEDDQFWLSVETKIEPSILAPLGMTRNLVRHAAAAVLHLSSDGTNFCSANSQHVAQVYTSCSRAILKCPWTSSATCQDFEGACARALFLLDVAFDNVENDSAAPETGTELLSPTARTPTRNSARALHIRGFSENLRRFNSNSLIDKGSLSLSSIIEFVLDLSTSAENLRYEVMLRRHRLENCIYLIETAQLEGLEGRVESLHTMLGLILSSASEGRLHYLDGFGGADAGLKKKYEERLLELLCTAVDVQPGADEFSFASACFGSFSMLATVKMNDIGIKRMLELNLWCKLVQLQMDTSGDEKLTLEEPGNLSNAGLISLSVMCVYVLETFQLRKQSTNTLSWQSSMILNLLSWLKSKSCQALGLRRALDILSLCTYDVRQVTSIKQNSSDGSSMTVVLLQSIFDFLFDHCLETMEHPVVSGSVTLLAPRILGMLSKWVGSSSPNDFDLATMHRPCERQDLISGDSPAGSRALHVLTDYLTRANLWSWDINGCDTIKSSKWTQMNAADRLIMTQSVADFLGEFHRQARWNPAALHHCKYLLEQKDLTGSQTERHNFVQVMIALAILGGNIPIVREGVKVMVADPSSDMGHSNAVVVQFKFSEERALIAKQDGELHWISATQLSPVSAQCVHASAGYLKLLLPFLQWQVCRILGESDMRASIMNTEEEFRLKQNIGLVPGNLHNKFFFARFQGATVMHLLSKAVVRNASDAYQHLSYRVNSRHTLADLLNQCALLCPDDVYGEQNLRFNIHTQAEKAAALQHAVFSTSGTQEQTAVGAPRELKELHRLNTILGPIIQNVSPSDQDRPSKFQRGLSGVGIQRHELWKLHSGTDSTNCASAESHLLALSSVYRDLCLSFAVNIAFELLPEHLNAMHSEAIASESNAQVIMKLLHLAVCFALPEERIRWVLARLLNSDRDGLPEYFIRVLLGSSHSSRLLRATKPEDELVRQTIMSCSHNRAAWSCDLGFGGSTTISIKEWKPVKGIVAFKKGSGVDVHGSERECQKFELEATGASYARIESCHNYKDNCDYKGSVQIVGAGGLSVVFDSSCRTESGCDVLSFFKDSAMTDKIVEISGNSNWNDVKLPGQDTIYYAFRSDGSCNYWGYRCDSLSSKIAF